MSKKPNPLSPKAALKWQQAMGVDEAVGDTPTGLYNFKSKATAKPVPIKASHAAPIPAATEFADADKLLQDVKDLAGLRAAIEKFDALAIRKSATNTVIADGNPNAKIMLIGEAPGAEEDKRGLPFVGAAGQLLDKMLGAIGLDRSKVYISNILFWRPPGNRTPAPEEMQLCMPFVRRHIELVQPKILVCLGGTAMKAMFPVKDGIMKLRGSWMDFKTSADAAPIPTLLTYHPAFLLRTPAHKKDSWADLQDLQKRMRELGIE